MNVENFVAELNGYLNMLRRLCFRRCDFSASSLCVSGEVEESLEKYVGNFSNFSKLISIERITKNELSLLLGKYIYSNINGAEENLIKIIDWDIREYLGLISMTPNGNRDIDLSTCLQVLMESDLYESLITLAIRCGEQWVVLDLGIREPAV